MKRHDMRHEVRQEPEILRAQADAHIAWVLAHPQMSDWLKQALRTAATLDPVTLQNEVEMLRTLVIAQAQARIALAASQDESAALTCRARPVS